MKFLIFFLLATISAVSFADDKVISDPLDILQFLMDNPVAQQNPLAIQLSRGETVKVTSISYSPYCVPGIPGPMTTMTIQVSNASGKTLATTSGVSIPCPK